MSVGIALVIIFILYLIDKHNRWLAAIKISIGAIVLGGFAIGAFMGWEKFNGWKESREKAKQVQEETAKAAKHDADVQKCVIDNLRGTASVYNAAGTSTEDLRRSWSRACEADANTTNINAGNDVQKELSRQAKTPTAWVPVDVFQQFGGYFVEPPTVPPQVQEAVKHQITCVPGSTTWGKAVMKNGTSFKVQWACVDVRDEPTGLPLGAVVGPAAK